MALKIEHLKIKVIYSKVLYFDSQHSLNTLEGDKTLCPLLLLLLIYHYYWTFYHEGSYVVNINKIYLQ